MSGHLCLTCRHANWKRKSKRLTGVGFCDAPDPALPALPAVKWWSAPAQWGILGGDIYRRVDHPVERCSFYAQRKT